MADNNEKPKPRKKGGPGRPFAKGVSPNPGGRPKILGEWRRSPEAQRLRDLSYETLERAIKARKSEWRDKIAASKELLDRIEGRPIQAISGPDGGPIQTVNLEKLSVEQLEQLEQLRKAALGE